MSGERRTKSYIPLDLNVLNASQLILPPLAGELDNTTVAAWVASATKAYGDIVRNGTNYYWCVTAGGGTAGSTPPTHTDGDASDGTLVWRYVRWHRDVITIINVAGAGTVSIARGAPAELNKGVTLFSNGAHNEGYEGAIRPYQGAWYGISDNAGGRSIAISEG